MIRFSISSKTVLYFALVYGFLVGGSLQFMGILSIVPGTVLISLAGLFLPIIICWPNYRIDLLSLSFCLLGFYILFIGAFRGTGIGRTVYYLSFVIIPFGFKILLDFGLRRLEFLTLFRCLNLIAIIQVPVLLFQFVFTEYFISLSSVEYALHDRMFGTFPIADDHGLGFFFLVMLLLNFFVVPKKERSLTTIVLIFFAIVFFLNSNITKLLLLLLVVMVGLRHMKLRIRMVFVIVFFIAFYLFINQILSFVGIVLGRHSVVNLNPDTVSGMIEVGLADRIQTVYYFIVEKFIFFIGNGPFSYFDPFDGRFVFNANFSQLIWFYYDLGFVGLFLFFALLFFLFRPHFSPLRYEISFLLIAFVVFSFFTTTFNSVTILVSLFIALHGINRFSYGEKKEHSCMPVS